jgi:hypothetical protein
MNEFMIRSLDEYLRVVRDELGGMEKNSRRGRHYVRDQSIAAYSKSTE